MAKRKNNATSPAVEVENDGTVTVEAVAEETTAALSNDDDAVLAALAAADSPFETVETVEAEIVTETVEMVETEAEVEAEIELDPDAVIAAAEAAETKTKAPKSQKKAEPATPVVVRQFCDVADHFDATSLKATLDGINAKKVHEKATNVVASIETGKKLSGFTKLAVKVLADKGQVTAKDLVEAYQADNKSIGTARAQAQQMTALFKALGIATPSSADNKVLVACDNALVKELTTLAA